MGLNFAGSLNILHARVQKYTLSQHYPVSPSAVSTYAIFCNSHQNSLTNPFFSSNQNVGNKCTFQPYSLLLGNHRTADPLNVGLSF